MMPSATLEPSERRDVKVELGAFALVVAVVVAGFGLAARPDAPVHAASERTAPVKAERSLRAAAPPEAGPRAPADRADRAASGKRDSPPGAPRECTPESGISDACSY